ncbi:Oidioi.mRNA.OKI2018_I69.chr2.g5431.t1.cds [Oikopleura dioica]|uniref:Oidioi.mRNA.OKI2018_I69.chr2.g5431.t1.cds n=1 Tax=Oikopleura dioica TaxID=34765 RepID=A0ABN7T693_OIKDI|nr:Oidioi.mRNA.OKI2018_I69.chr2.g5431.t1.cds [Oikopleura dioica]
METLTKSLIWLIKHRKSHPKKDFDLETHLFFDDSFDRTTFGKETNKWVNQYLRILQRLFVENGEENVRNQGRISETPYGERMVFRAFGADLTIHLKDSEKIKRGKRWSQVMYMNYLCNWKIGQEQMKDSNGRRADEKNSFILALDGDVDFQPKDFDLVLSRMLKSSKIGACCNQIQPNGTGPLVWF